MKQHHEWIICAAVFVIVAQVQILRTSKTEAAEPEPPVAAAPARESVRIDFHLGPLGFSLEREPATYGSSSAPVLSPTP